MENKELYCMMLNVMLIMFVCTYHKVHLNTNVYKYIISCKDYYDTYIIVVYCYVILAYNRKYNTEMSGKWYETFYYTHFTI